MFLDYYKLKEKVQANKVITKTNTKKWLKVKRKPGTKTFATFDIEM